MNNFIFSDSNKRYNTLNFYNKTHFSRRIMKASINAGMTCPNIDGTKGVGGCTYCDGAAAYFADGRLSVAKQLESEICRIGAKYSDAEIIAYFQANSNTYADIDTLRNMFNTVLRYDIFGITVATRADCINAENVALLAEYAKITHISVELGLQTVHDETAEKINRCHSFAEFLTAYELLKSSGLRVCVHIINGLPGETAEMMIETAKQLGRMRPDGVKIHMLHIISGTKLAEEYSRGMPPLLTMEQYADIVVKQLEYLAPETVIERLTGDGDKSRLIAPEWTKNKKAVIAAIDKRQAQLNSYQGKLFI